jgi:hypothetical protein
VASEIGFTFLPIYIPTYSGLSQNRGTKEGQDAVGQAAAYGFGPGQNPICLDIEAATYAANPQECLAYVDGWIASVHAAGYVAAVYGNPAPLVAMSALQNPPDCVWAADPLGQQTKDALPPPVTRTLTTARRIRSSCQQCPACRRILDTNSSMFWNSSAARE